MKIDHGLIMLDDTHCAGYLFDFGGHDIFSPDGRVEVTKEQVEEHNRLLSEAELLGLDQNCQVGQHGTFYLRKEPVLSVITWMGVLVSDRVVVHGQTITFKRDGKAYRGRLRKDADCFNFRRVS